MTAVTAIAVIPGDGIGPEVTAQAVRTVHRASEVFGIRLRFEHLPWSADHFLATGATMPADGYQMLRDQFDAILVGALGDPRVPESGIIGA